MGDLYPDSDSMVVRESPLITNSPLSFPHQAKSWRRCVPVILELTEVWRQADQTFISLLQAVRLGRWVPEKGPWNKDACMGLCYNVWGWQASCSRGWWRIWMTLNP